MPIIGAIAVIIVVIVLWYVSTFNGIKVLDLKV